MESVQKHDSFNAVGVSTPTEAKISWAPQDHDREDTCGLCLFRPKILQRFRTAKWVLLWLCLAGMIQGMVVNGFVNVSISTIEKRYNLPSSTTGWIASMYDIACVLCAIPVSYFGSRPGASKPRWLGWGVLIMGAGSFIFALPHFSSGSYSYSADHNSTNNALLCLKEASASPNCKLEMEEWLSNYKYVFLLGQFLHGVGASPLYTLGTTFMDESVSLKMSSLYIGIFHTMAVIGPAIGFVLGGKFLDIYIDTPETKPELSDISSDKLLGAWWIGFLISGGAAVLLSWIGILFPAEIPGGEERRMERLSAGIEVTNNNNVSYFGKLKDLPSATLVLMKNFVFIFISLAEATEGLLMSGFATFMPKIIESQFSVSPGYAALLVGFIAVPAGGGGTFLGGWLVKKFRLDCAAIYKFCSAFCFLTLLFGFVFLTNCPNIPLVGVQVKYNTRLSNVSLISECNIDCHCQERNFDPVCGDDELMYFSPCYAGCTHSRTLDNKKIYSNCSCVSEDLPSLSDSDHSNKTIEWGVSRNKCTNDCVLLPLFLCLFFIVLLFTFIISMPSVSGTLRCVPFSHRSFGLGVQWIIIRVLGTIPGPILFGSIIDNTCVLWQQTCDGTGACKSYDNYQLSRSMLSLTLSFKALSTLFYLLSYLCYKIKSKQIGNNDQEVTKDLPEERNNFQKSLSVQSKEGITNAAFTQDL